MEEPDEPPQTLSVDAELNQLFGLFDAPAFVRRGQDLEYALGRIRARCERERSAMLDMVRVRLRLWAAAVTGPAMIEGAFAASIESLWTCCHAEPPAWSERPAPESRRRQIARDLVASIERFNRRWTRFLDELNLGPINHQVDQYNRYYVLEKECFLGSTRLAARHFSAKPRLTRESLEEDFPALPVPQLLD
jgi:hypothetical protein